MYGSPTTSRDLNLAFEVASGESQKEGENLRHQHHQQMSSGLPRYRSASALIGETGDDFSPHRSSATETEGTAARFTSHNPREQMGGKSPATSGPATSTVHHRIHLMTATGDEHREKAGSSSYNSPMMYYSLSRDQLPPHRSTSVAAQEIRPESLNNNNLVRHSSSPAGLFSELSLEHGTAIFFFFQVLGGNGIEFSRSKCCPSQVTLLWEGCSNIGPVPPAKQLRVVAEG